MVVSRWNQARLADAHRPWPPPGTPWVGRMSWQDVLFLSWPVAPERVEPHILPGLEVDLHDGQAWVTLVALTMGRAGPRFGPRLPSFAELNLRTYVTGDKPGVLFFSLHAPDPLVVGVGRMMGIPYRMARTTRRARRFASRAGRERFAASYDVGAERVHGPLDRFLVERYALFTGRRRRRRIEVQHPAWRLRDATAQVVSHGLVDAFGVEGPPQHVAFSPGVDAVMWAPQPALPGPRRLFSSHETA